ncbi:hypothetical protein [Novosphingobium sp. Rr 2-17]|uniref:hypothetical protein n=1 Tax=Novosphingobium sp. Rr 2-17 TaxID=555793 RepID=UPI001ED90157|nr:hypothetical protein [Novosphingobium sp. Rr 2-17]
MFGLCAMLLIVGLANVIRDRLVTDTSDPMRSVIAVDTKPTKAASDPLADIGVVPASSPNPSQGATEEPSPPAK